MPGGADYAMLFAVKHGWMAPLQEKRYNAAINVWVREPALVVTATLGWIQLHAQKHEELSGWGVASVRALRTLPCARPSPCTWPCTCPRVTSRDLA